MMVGGSSTVPSMFGLLLVCGLCPMIGGRVDCERKEGLVGLDCENDAGDFH